MSGNIGKVAIVTGASSGIGAAVAEGLARAGMRVMLAARREDRLKTLTASLRQEGCAVDCRVTDVADRLAVQRLADATVSAFGRIDALINNAGVLTFSFLSEGDVEAWDQMIDVNIKGVLYGIAAVLPVMQQQKSGHIINISSTSAHGVVAGGAVYGATKCAVNAISEAFRQEAGPTIRSTIISPGAVTSAASMKSPFPQAPSPTPFSSPCPSRRMSTSMRSSSARPRRYSNSLRH
jgi:NADP-dependent 3-hydroxy acid dehydrogenase YdfG